MQVHHHCARDGEETTNFRLWLSMAINLGNISVHVSCPIVFPVLFPSVYCTQLLGDMSTPQPSYSYHMAYDKMDPKNAATTTTFE